jgi:hypothetical protein
MYLSIERLCDAQHSAARRDVHKLHGVLHRCSAVFMSDDKVIPFKPRPRVLSQQELEVFRHATRNWHPQLRDLMFPDHVKQENERSKD